MRRNSFSLFALLLSLCSLLSSAGTCSCDLSARHREISEHSLLHSSRRVVFRDAEESKRGLNYKRPLGASPRFIPKKTRNKKEEKDGTLRKVKENEEEDNCQSDQVHISLGYDLNAAIISFTSPYVNTSSMVYYSTDSSALLQDDDIASNPNVLMATGTFQAYSEILYLYTMALYPDMGEPYTTEEDVLYLQDTSRWAYDHKTGEHYANWNNVTEVYFGGGQYNNPDMMYQSPAVHTVQLSGLQNGVTYYYRVSGSCDVHHFKLPYFSFDSEDNAESYPFILGMTGDLGQTEVSDMSLTALAALKPSAVLLVGDLSYADGWSPAWDSFGQMFESLAATIPVLTTGGNHENGFAENNVPYYTRYSTPHAGSGSPDQNYWGREVGPVHVIAMYSYAGYTPDSLQYQWLENYLATKINRQRTPWVLVMSHMGWYNSNTGHWMEAEHTRSYLEPLLYEYGVDILLGGHVHSYERSFPVYNNTLDECGIVSLNLGDGGNYEGAYVPWRIDNSTVNGAPEWSAFRESSFGVGGLTVVNSTHAFYAWHRHACESNDPENGNMNFSTYCRSPGDNSEQSMETSDIAWLVRPSISSCPNKWTGTSSFKPQDSFVSSSNDNDDDDDLKSFSTLEIVLGAAALAFFLSTVVLGFLFYRARSGEKDDDKTSLVQEA